jgi:hypothetical protein
VIHTEHAIAFLDALARMAESGPVFDAIYGCLVEVKKIQLQEVIEDLRDRSLEDLEISVRLDMALRVRGIKTVRQLEACAAKDLMRTERGRYFFGKKMLRETRDLLCSLGGLKLYGDP